MAVILIGQYDLIDKTSNYETMWRSYAINGVLLRRLERRKVVTHTWEAPLADNSDTPIDPNPGSLSEPWRLQSVTDSHSYGVPGSRRIQVQWSNKYPWEAVNG